MAIRRLTKLCAIVCVVALTWACGSSDGDGGTAASQEDGGMNSDQGTQSNGDGSPEQDSAVTMGQPDIRLSAPSLALVLPPQGTDVSGELTLTNVGNAPLTLSRVVIEQVDGMNFSFAPVVSPGQTLAEGESLELNVTYSAPLDTAGHSAELVVESDDPDAPEIRATLSGRAGETCIRAMPTSLDLGGIDPGIRSGRFEVNIVNCGDLPYTVGAVSIDGDTDFSWTTRNETDPVGVVLARGNSLTLLVDYQNNRLTPDEVTTGNLVVSFEEAWAEPINIGLRARGGNAERCSVRVEPQIIDFEILRLGLTRTLDVQVTNIGLGACELNDIVVEHTDGEMANRFVLTRGIDSETLEGGVSYTLQITYEPTLENPVGDQGNLRIAYHDTFRNMNRAENVLLRGTGSPASIGSVPAVIDFGETTQTDCASRVLRIGAENVGFVPLTTTAYRVEGEDCGRFILLETPTFEDEEGQPGLLLERGERAEFALQFEPIATGRVECDIVVTSDAQNGEEVRLPIVGTGTDTPDRSQTHEVGRLNPERDAHWSLQYRAVANTVRVFVNDDSFRAFTFEDDRNRIAIEPDNHPDEGDELRIDYDGFCYPRQGD